MSTRRGIFDHANANISVVPVLNKVNIQMSQNYLETSTKIRLTYNWLRDHHIYLFYNRKQLVYNRHTLTDTNISPLSLYIYIYIYKYLHRWLFLSQPPFLNISLYIALYFLPSFLPSFLSSFLPSSFTLSL